MLDGKYWVLYAADGLIGVTTDESCVMRVLAADYQKEMEVEIPEYRFGLRLKFDVYRLTLDGIPVADYYAVNAQEVGA
jgi:hypothetical protein